MTVPKFPRDSTVGWAGEGSSKRKTKGQPCGRAQPMFSGTCFPCSARGRECSTVVGVGWLSDLITQEGWHPFCTAMVLLTVSAPPGFVVTFARLCPPFMQFLQDCAFWSGPCMELFLRLSKLNSL